MEKVRVRAFKVPETKTEVTFKDSSSLAITFTVPNISLLKNRTEAIVSPRFNIRRSSWQIKVTPKFGEKGKVPRVRISLRHSFLQPAAEFKDPIANVEIDIPDTKHGPWRKTVGPDDNVFGKLLGQGLIMGPDAMKPLKEDHLMIRVKVDMLYQEAISDELPRYRLCKIFGSEVGRDFTLVSGDGDERHVHKAVLNASSPVFERMFQSNLEECRTGRCVIPDISTATLDMLLNFMYHCSVADLTKNAMEILPPADKYEIFDLKKACEEALKNTVNLENMADLLVLADMFSATELKGTILKIVETKPDKREDTATAGAITALEDRAIKSGRTDLVREVFSAGYKSGRKL